MPGPTLGCSTCAQAAKGQDGTRRGLGWSWVQLAGVVLTPSGPSFPGCAGFPGGPGQTGPTGRGEKGRKRRVDANPCNPALAEKGGARVQDVQHLRVALEFQFSCSLSSLSASTTNFSNPHSTLSRRHPLLTHLFSPQWQHPTTPIPTRHNGCAGYAVQAGECPAPSELRVNRVQS